MAKESQGRSKAGSDYSAKHITVLEGLEPVRKRPGMYIGNTAEEGLHHLIWEVIDNSIDEAMAGFCDTIKVTLNEDRSVTVEDNGRGIPTEKHPVTKVSTLETVMTKLHAGGKFGQGAYKVSGGLHGVGVSVVNALSKYMRAEVHFKGKVWVQEYERGKPKRAAHAIGTTKRTGTTVTFNPDDTIFTVLNFSWETVLAHVRQQAYLTKGVRMEIHDRRIKEEPRDFGFYFEGGVASYCKHLNHNKEVKNEVFYIEREVDKMKVEIAVQYTDDYKETVVAFANNIHTVEGGMHVIGFRTALTRSLNTYARKSGFLKEKDDNLGGEDVREGLTAIISVKIPDPQFEGQTKAKLGNAEIRPLVESVMNDYFTAFLDEHPNDARQILGKVLLAQAARVAARAARESVLRKGALEGFMLPGKLADCSSKKTEECELYIVEGDSAGGSAKSGRDRNFQAILPLRGKILNVEKSRIDKMLANNEIKSLVMAMGTNIGELFDIAKLRYGKIIIMTDADVDGSHIRTLLLTFFYRHFPQLITEEHIFIAQPPLYQLKKGKHVVYVYSDEEKRKALESFGVAPTKKEEFEAAPVDAGEPQVAGDVDIGEKIQGVVIQRYKGLGEMNPDQLWETTMRPDNRMLKRVTVDDAEKANEIFDILMGSEVAPRKRFIQTHAKAVKNLDI